MTKKDSVFKYLRQAIISGDYKPGDHIVEQDICKRFKMSRSPVREAINQLEKEGLVTISPNVGAKVVELTLDDLSDIFDLLEVMEGASSRFACQKLNDEEIDELEEIHFMMIEAANKKNLELFFELNIQFHRFISSRTKNRYLIEVWGNLRAITAPVVQLSQIVEGQTVTAIEGHQKMIGAFKKHNPALAELVTRNHLKDAKKHMLNYYESLSDDEPLPGLLRLSN